MKNRFNKPDPLKRIINGQTLSILVFALVIAVFIIGINSVSNSTLTDDRRLLEKAVTRDIVHCYAVEGVYPPSLSYIEEHYGLVYDESTFFVDYQPIASNMYPDVTVIKVR